ncbi:MAG TPA: UDP-3-O-(3-hydroxymyristoyl)glucosamine N-acyltransferase, partial [Thermoanaerobaculia bacterium]
PRPWPAGVHQAAVVGQGCVVDATAHVGPYAVIGDGSRIGAGAVVQALAVVGRGCTVGDRAVLDPHSVLDDGTELGAGAIVHAGAVLGSDGFGYTFHQGAHRKVPQVGRVVVEADVEIGANTAIDRATLGETRIGAGTKIDNLVQIGHNVRIGRSSIVCGQAGVAGSCTIGDGVVLAGQAGIGDHLNLADGSQVAAQGGVLHDVPPGVQVAGYPAMPARQFRRQLVLLSRLGEMEKRLRALEKRLGAAHHDSEEE